MLSHCVHAFDFDRKLKVIDQSALVFFFIISANRKIIPKDTYVDSRMFAMRGADQVCLFWWPVL